MTEITSETFSVRWDAQMHDESVRRVACYQCRRRKVKCDKRKPSCRTCVQNHQNCKYPVDVARPGPKLGSKYTYQPKNIGTSNNSETLTAMMNPVEESRVHESHTTGDLELLQTRPERRGSESAPEGVRIAPSWILHNFHETQSYQIHETAILTPSASPASPKIPRTIQSSNAAYICQALQIAQSTLAQLIEQYFDNMTTMTLLRRPTFYTYLYSVLTPKLSAALAAAMLTFSARFEPLPGRNSDVESLTEQSADRHARAEFYFEKASDFTAECLRELGDDSPPLGLLQAMIITTSVEMVDAARGKAWRLLGTCIRLAYELRLHEVDATMSQPSKKRPAMTTELWIMDEERRRVWWSLWELDVFISTVNMLPVSMGDVHNATLLPVEDEAWFAGQQRESSFLEADPVRRWKQLEQSGNQSGKAWYIVINSFTRDIHCLSYPTLPLNRFETDQGGPNSKLATKFNTLANCVTCFILALPESLSYKRFSPADDIDWGSRRRMSEKHVIHLMFLLTKLYIHHHECFNRDSHTRSAERIVNQPLASPTPSLRDARSSSSNLQHTKAWHDYAEVSDEMAQVVRNSHIDHVRYGHPLLVNTYWMVAAIQLLRKRFATSEEEIQLAQSNFDLIKLTLVRHQKFWNASPTPLANLTALSQRLDPLATRSHTSYCSSEQRTETTSKYNNPMAQPHGNSCEDSNGRDNCAHDQSHTLMSAAVPMTIDDPYTFAQTGQNLQDFAGSSNALGHLPRMGGNTSELSNGNSMDNNGLQAYMDSILSNKWIDWPENIDFENLG